MFDSDTASLRLLVGIFVLVALIFGAPLLLSFRRRLAQQKKDRLILAQRRRDEARWQKIQDENRSKARETSSDEPIG